MIWHNSYNVLVILSFSYISKRFKYVRCICTAQATSGGFLPSRLGPRVPSNPFSILYSLRSIRVLPCEYAFKSELDGCLLDKKDGNLFRPLSLGARLTAWAATSPGQGAASPQHFLYSQIHLANWRTGESFVLCFLKRLVKRWNLKIRFGLYLAEVGECQQGVVFLSSKGKKMCQIM